jgi:hypothetical protein
MEKAGTVNGPEKGDEGDINSNKEFKKLKCQAARKQRVKKKQALRKYFKKNDSNLSITIQSKQYKNPENLNKKKRKRRPSSNDKKSNSEDNANLLRIRFNPSPLYGAFNEQK